MPDAPAWSLDDLARIRSAYALGASSTRYADGREVKFISRAEMWRTIKDIEASLGLSSDAPTRVVAGYRSGLSS